MSVLSAKHLAARHVISTDGDEGVVEALKENLFLNGLDDAGYVNASVLRWGRALKGSWVEDEGESWPVDVVVGADIVRTVSDFRGFKYTADGTTDVRQAGHLSSSRNAAILLRHAAECKNSHIWRCAKY